MIVPHSMMSRPALLFVGPPRVWRTKRRPKRKGDIGTKGVQGVLRSSKTPEIR